MNFKSLFNFFLYSKHSVVIFLLVFTQLVITGFAKVLTKTNAYNDLDQMRFAMMAFLFALIFGSVIKIYSFYTFAKHLKIIKEDDDIYSFTGSKITDWAIIEIRAQVRVLLRLFLFIIPGIVEAIRLSLSVPYVFLDKRMKDPTFDPIEESRAKITLNGLYFWPLFLVTIVIPIIIALATNSDQTVFDSAQSLSFGVLGSVAQTVSIVIYYAYIINIFTTQNEEEKTRS